MIDDSSLQAQLNLIEGADLSHWTKRFIPSEFGIIANPETIKIDPYGRYILASAKALEKTKLQYTRISTGFFMDFWGTPATHTTMSPVKWVFDIQKGLAIIPGTGGERFSMTHTMDLARCIVLLQDEECWPHESGIVGQDVTCHEVLTWLEDATGRSFDVRYDSAEDLKNGKCTSLGDDFESPEQEKFHAAFGRLLVEGHMYLPRDTAYRLNTKFSDYQPLTVEKMIETSWKT